jgi:hypothetical protein
VGDFRSYVDVISCKATDLRELAHRVCSRISPLVMALQAQAIQDAWGTSGKTLCGPITCDMRQCFDSQGIGNFSGYVTGALDAQLSGAPLETLCAALQRAMEAQLTTGRPAPAARSRHQRDRDGAGKVTRRDIRLHRTPSPARSQNPRFISLYVSNVGAMRLPEPLSALVTAAECGCTSFTATYNLTMMGVGDSVRMTLMRTFADDTLTHAFASVLERTGVAVNLEKRGRRAFPTTGRDCVLVLD